MNQTLRWLLGSILFVSIYCCTITTDNAFKLEPDFQTEGAGCLAGTGGNAADVFADMPAILKFRDEFKKNFPKRAKLKPIKIYVPNWGSAQLVSFVTSFLLTEVMGLPSKLEFIKGGADAFDCVADGTVDVCLETWIHTKSAQIQKHVIDNKRVAMRPLGFAGKEGIYVSLAEQVTKNLTGKMCLPALAEQWSLLKDPAAAKLFTDHNMTNVPLADGTWACNSDTNTKLWDKSKAKCVNGRYIPPQCEADPFKCKELILADPGWATGWLEAVVTNLKLNYTVPFVGAGGMEATIKAYDKKKQPALFFWWEPDVLLKKITATRVQLPVQTSTCRNSHTKDFLKSGVNCDLDIDHVSIINDADLKTKNRALHDMLQKLIIGEKEVHEMLDLTIKHKIDRAACNWVKGNFKTWKKWIGSSDPLPPPPAPPTENKNLLPPGVRALAYLLFGILFTLAAGFFTWTTKNAKTNLVSRAQPVFLKLICCGCCTSIVSILLMSMDEGSLKNISSLNMVCQLEPWFYCMGFVVTFSSLFAKIWRVHKIFGNVKMRKLKVTVKDLLKYMMIGGVIEAIILLIWTVQDPLEWKRTCTKYGNVYDSYKNVQGQVCAESVGSCKSNNAWAFIAPLFILHVSALFYASFLCYKVRNVPSDFQESKWIGMAIFSDLQILLLGVPMTYLVYNTPVAYFIIRIGIVALNDGGDLCLMFVPKLFQPLEGQADALQTQKTAQTKASVRTAKSSAPRSAASTNSNSSHPNAVMPYDASSDAQ